MARWDANLQNVRWASLPQLWNVSTAKGMYVHPNSWHLRPLGEMVRHNHLRDVFVDCCRWAHLSMSGEESWSYKRSQPHQTCRLAHCWVGQGQVCSFWCHCNISLPSHTKGAMQIIWYSFYPSGDPQAPHLPHPCRLLHGDPGDQEQHPSKRGIQFSQHPHLATTSLQSGTHYYYYYYSEFQIQFIHTIHGQKLQSRKLGMEGNGGVN